MRLASPKIQRRALALLRVIRARLKRKLVGLRRRYLSIGGRGEAVAARWLQQRGYIIIQRNWRSRLGEIDLIAIDKRTLVFIEVKTRKKIHAKRFPAELSINQQKVARLKRLAQQYSDSHLRFIYRDRITQLRFDTIAVYYQRVLGGRFLKTEVEHSRGAF